MEKETQKKSRTKKLIIFATAAVVALVLVFVVQGILRNNNLHQLALNNIAEARFYMKQGETANLRVNFSSGMREEPFIQNGIGERNVAFALINVEPKNTSLSTYTELNGRIRLGEEEIEVTIGRNEFRQQNFALDLERLVERGTSVVLILTLTNDVLTIPLQDSMPEDAITWERALEIAVENSEEKIRGLGSFETYIKIIADRGHNAVFWYVQFLNREAQTVFVVISPTGEVIGSTQAAA